MPPEGYAARAGRQVERGDDSGPILLLHGLGGDREQLREVLDRALLGDPTVVRADARMHGEFIHGERSPRSFAAMAADQWELLDHLGLTAPTVLVGVSMGAGTAIRMRHLRPERVRAMVLIRPAWTHEAPHHLRPVLDVARTLRTAGSASAARAQYLASDGFARMRADSPASAASLLRQFDQPHARARVARLEDIVSSSPYPDPAWLRPAVPTLVLTAPRDALHPAHVGEAIATATPDATLVALPPAGDAQRAALREHVNAFVRSVPQNETREEHP